ncbi:MAG: heavy-metal-associated domain-containing protein [Chloroflexi bacterium]|nr:heavy-metal-associated domain-containing protein [Chloroflexota bacterium]
MKTTIKVSGMSCANCVRHMSEALQGLDGIKDVQIDLPTGEVTFEKVDSVTMDEVATVVQEAGYQMVK